MSENEVIDEETAETARALPAVRVSEAMVARDEISAADVLGQRDKIRQVMDAVMEKGVHYGEIPGISKPTLLKPGAEVLAVTFRLAPSYKSEKVFHDDGHLTVISAATLTHIPTGLVVAEGEGLCTSREKKYAFRGEGRVCPVCDAPAIKRSKFAPRESDYDGASTSDAPGWYCHAKTGGCGANFAAEDPRILGQEAGKIANPDLPDTWNTVLKMANKRALVAAILNGTAASDIFTQDVEDGNAEDAAAPSQQQQPERRQETAGRGAQVPRSWAEIKAALERELGVEEAAIWGAQAKQATETLPPPTPFQRMCGVVVDLLEKGGEWQLLPDAREAIQQVFAGRLDGLVLSGPEWALTGEEAEAGTPAKEEILKSSA